jgi:hypothetical protein
MGASTTVESTMTSICSLVETAISDVIQHISVDYNIPYDELLIKYLNRSSIPKVVPKRKSRRKVREEAELLATEEYQYEGKTFLVDDSGTVYTYDLDNPTMIGTMMPNGTINFLSQRRDI